MSRAARSLVFFIACFAHLVLVMEPVPWLLLRPLIALLPSRRQAIIRAWMRSQAQVIVWLARVLGGMRLTVQGELPATSAVVVMNHQSLLDIPLALSMIRGPYPLIPTRASYRFGVPGISSMLGLGRHPMVGQGRTARRAEVRALLAAIDEVAEGRQSFLVFPEGHRSRNGEILPFMSAGLRQVLDRVGQRPLYLIVADGLWTVRTFSDIAFRLAGTSVRAVVLGPYTIPGDREKHGEFVEFLRLQMVETLDRLRAPAAGTPPLAAQPQLAR